MKSFSSRVFRSFRSFSGHRPSVGKERAKSGTKKKKIIKRQKKRISSKQHESSYGENIGPTRYAMAVICIQAAHDSSQIAKPPALTLEFARLDKARPIRNPQQFQPGNFRAPSQILIVVHVPFVFGYLGILRCTRVSVLDSVSVLSMHKYERTNTLPRSTNCFVGRANSAYTASPTLIVHHLSERLICGECNHDSTWASVRLLSTLY